mmetsp:Transcript_22071/g.21255  ORF Transcript_22071/g.21255 Transcript_22071/m.21255 type:complete len:304 (+) Transcript_22071:180-1091(+)
MLADGFPRCIVEGICFRVLGLKVPLSSLSQHSILINVDHLLKGRIGLIELGGFPMLDTIYEVFDMINLAWFLRRKAQELSMEHTIDNLHFGLLISIMINDLFSLVQDVKNPSTLFDSGYLVQSLSKDPCRSFPLPFAMSQQVEHLSFIGTSVRSNRFKKAARSSILVVALHLDGLQFYFVVSMEDALLVVLYELLSIWERVLHSPIEVVPFHSSHQLPSIFKIYLSGAIQLSFLNRSNDMAEAFKFFVDADLIARVFGRDVLLYFVHAISSLPINVEKLYLSILEVGREASQLDETLLELIFF